MNYNQYIKENTLRLDASRRGGGIEIDCSEILKTDGAKMTAYQNYLGGGLLGSIQSDSNFQKSDIPLSHWKTIDELTEALKRYFHEITNEEAEDYDEWNSTEFEALQNRSASAY